MKFEDSKEEIKNILIDFIDRCSDLSFTVENEVAEVPDRFLSHFEPNGYKTVTLRGFYKSEKETHYDKLKKAGLPAST